MHGISAADVADAPSFAERVAARARVLRRATCSSRTTATTSTSRSSSGSSGETLACTYDTLPLARKLFTSSASLVNLAERLGVDRGRSHRALDDVRTLAKVFLALRALNDAYARKTALAHLLDYVAVALVLWPDELHDEAAMLRDRAGALRLRPVQHRARRVRRRALGARRRLASRRCTTSSSGSAARS